MTLAESYAYCERVARSRAANFYWGFLLLSKPQRLAMCAIYAFMRYCDDLSDDTATADRLQAIAGWKADLANALEGNFSADPVWPAFHDAVTRYHIPHQYFHDMIAGVSSDVTDTRRIRTFEELYDYCYHVASVVGLTIVHIFGFEDPAALPLAEKCGIAFQITNILRDIGEDAGNNRIYLPEEDLHRFGVRPEELVAAQDSPRFRQLMRFEADRAEDYYRQSLPLIEMVHRRSRGCLWALIEIYHRLLHRIQATDYDVMTRRVRLPLHEKLAILFRGHFR